MQNLSLTYIDTHCHLNLAPLLHRADEIIDGMKKQGFGAVIVGINIESSHIACQLARQHDHLWATVGLHPNHVDNENIDETFREYEQLLAEFPDQIVGIGECGYDYFRTVGGRDMLFHKQTHAFEKQIELAATYDLPMMLHLRPTDRSVHDAYDDALVLLEKHHHNVRVNAHFFASDYNHAIQFIKKGHMVSFTGVVTFVKEYQELVAQLPIGKVMAETDAPYVSPAPHRGAQCIPQYVQYIYDAIADACKQDREEVRQQLVENAVRFWGLS